MPNKTCALTDQKIQLVVSDMDGTLLTPDREISDESCRAVAEAEKRGIRFSICTGRIEPMTKSYQKRLDLKTPIITANGALIWDPVRNCTLWGCPMQKDELMKFLYFCRDNDLDYCVLTMEESFFSPHNMRRERFEQYNRTAKREGLPPMKLRPFDEDFSCVRGLDVYKVLLCENAPGNLDLAKSFIDTLKETEYTSSDENLLDVGHQGVDKGFGLLNLAKLLQIPLRNVCAVGDFDNDIPMLLKAGFPVAMGNATAPVKEMSAYVTKSNQEDGVAYLLQELCSSKENP